jgi:SAM-dependent methyltransferase
MLKVAARRVEGVPLHCGDMVDFDLGRKFDVVCCLFRSIAYLKTPDRLIAATQSMARHLAPDGLLIIEPFFTPESYWVDRVTLNECVRDDLKIAWMYVSEKREAIGRMLINFLVGTPRGVQHFTELHEMGLFSRENFEDAFRRAGLELEYEPNYPGGTGMYFGRHRNPQS